MMEKSDGVAQKEREKKYNNYSMLVTLHGCDG